MVNAKYQASPEMNTRCDKSIYECRTVSMFNQYTWGIDWWGTARSSLSNVFDIFGSLFNTAKIMDKAATNEAVDFINNYFSKNNPDGKRKRFPAVFSVYFSGLDHYAHAEGMGGYAAFFRETTDVQVKDVVNALKQQDEFDNKIFIIVADHGHTAMPTDLEYKDKNWLGFEVMKDAEMSCKLKLDFIDPENPDHITGAQKAELANNNLHIWELGDYLKTIGEFVEQATTQVVENKILAPKEIAELFTDPATGQPLRNGAVEKAESANIIAALNGPMAHIYVKGSDWSATTDINRVLEVAEIFRVTLQGARGGDSPLPIFPAGMAERFGYKVGRLSNASDEILVRDGGVYKVYSVNNASVILKDLNSLSSEYVDATNRIEKMNNVKRSGDIVLIMKDNTSGSALDRYTTGVACKSWHGSLSRSDSYVPFIFAYPGGNKTEIETILKKDSICLSDYSNCKGNWKLTDTIKEIIKEQYQ